MLLHTTTTTTTTATATIGPHIGIRIITIVATRTVFFHFCNNICTEQKVALLFNEISLLPFHPPPSLPFSLSLSLSLPPQQTINQ